MMVAHTGTPRDLLILSEQVYAVYRTSRSVAAAHGLVAILLFFGLLEGGNRPLMLFWALCVCLVVGAYLWWGREFKKATPGPELSPMWARRRTMLGLAAGIVWGFAGAALFPASDIAGQALVTMVLVGIAAGSFTASASYLPANYALVIPMLVPLIVSSAMSGTTQGRIITVLLVIYMGFILTGARNINRVLVDSLYRRFQNVDLIDALTIEKTAADRARQAAETANRAKSQFLAAASHDLRQPLHALGLFAAALEEKIRYPEVRSVVDSINASVSSLEALFNELLDISKLDAGIVTASHTNFRLQPLFDRMAANHGAASTNKGLRLTIMPTDLTLYSDSMLIERILNNLVSNAVRYTNRGKILVGARRCRESVRLEVWDTGIGIPEDQQDKIFEEFYQLTNPERDRMKGLGLGLAIVRRLTQLLDHPLRLASQINKGSVFRITVPVGKIDQLVSPVAASETVEQRENLAHKHIIFIDDEVSVRKGMETLLKQWGCKVTVASSLEECKQMLTVNPQKPDLIISDYRMRESATGAEAIRELQMLFGNNIPGVLITGDTAPDRIQEAQASGFYLLHKPVVPGRLRIFLSVVLSKAAV